MNNLLFLSWKIGLKKLIILKVVNDPNLFKSCQYENVALQYDIYQVF